MARLYPSHRLFKLLFGSIIFLCAISAPAAELTVIPQVFGSQRDFEYRAGAARVNSTIHSLGLGITATLDKLYLNISGEKNLTPGEDGDISLNREDTAASFGYTVNESISLFCGYKYGETRLDLPATPGSNELRLSAQGPFIGAGGGWTLGHGVVSFSAAYARMGADYFSDEKGYSGQSAGTSLSVQWKANLSDKLHYHLAIIRHDYYYREFNDLALDITENVLSFRLGLGYRF